MPLVVRTAQRDSYPVFVGDNAHNVYRLGDVVQTPSGESYLVSGISNGYITISRPDPTDAAPMPPTPDPLTSWEPEDTLVHDVTYEVRWDSLVNEETEAPSRRPKRVMITGSRTWTDEDKIRKALFELPPGSTIIHGNARGADKIADRIARELGFEVEIFRADWKGEGRRAGILRNLRMVETNPRLVLAFWDGESRGTAHAIRAAHDHHRGRITTRVFYPDGINDER